MLIWLIVIVLSIGIEVVTLGLTTIWFAGGGVAALIAAALNAPEVVQILLFFAVSLLLLAFTRPIAVKYFNRDRVKTNVDGLIGKQAIVIGEIDNLLEIGQVLAGGQEWSARSTDDSVRLQAGTVVNIVEIRGVKLIVQEAGQLMKNKEQ